MSYYFRYNDSKPVPNSRDCQEIPFDIGVQVLEIFEKYKNQTSILDDYEFYEAQEKAIAKDPEYKMLSNHAFLM